VPAGTPRSWRRGCAARARLIAIDRDPTVAPFFDRLPPGDRRQGAPASGEFSTVLQHLAENGVKADVILLDLGVSSMQLDRPDRGFSYASMRRSTCAWTRTPRTPHASSSNEGDERELADIFKRYGEERYARSDRPCDRQAPAEPAVRAHGGPGRGDQGRDSSTCTLR